MTGRSFCGCFASVDGTDIRIFEPSPFDSRWYSHKFRGPGVRFEIGVAVSSGRLVWVNGPFRCGDNPDINIFRSGMKTKLRADELVVADDGYKDPRCLRFQHVEGEDAQTHARISARHETVNRRFKHFSVLGGKFRHALSRHGLCFHAVAKPTSLLLDSSDPLFEIDF